VSVDKADAAAAVSIRRGLVRRHGKRRDAMTFLRSAKAVALGFLFIFVSSTAIDVVLHAAGVFPPWGEANPDGVLVLATTYRIFCSIAGCYLAARLAPAKPIKHALALGVVGVAESGHDEHRLLVETRPVRGQHLARLGGVGGSGDERERHGRPNVRPSRDA